MIKRFLSVLLSLIMIIQFFPMQALAEELNNNNKETEITSEDFSKNTLQKQDLVTSDQYTVLVLDGSSSMGGAPIKALKEAVMTFSNNLISSSNKIAVVSFGFSATVLTDFTDDVNDIQNILDDIYNGSGTHVKSGLVTANELLSIVPSDARKNMVVFSDGEPSDGSQSLSYAHSLQDVDIYTIGFFQDLSEYSKSKAEEFLKELCNKNYYDITNIEDFNEVFEDVAGDIKLSDQMKKYIQDHENYINGDYYNIEINPGLYGASAEALDSIKGNWSLKGYNVVTTLNDWLGGKVSKENYYKYILAAFVDSEKNHASCNNEYLSSLQTNLEQVYFTSLINIQTNINAGVPGYDPNEYNAARAAYDQMKDADFLSSDYKYSKQALDTCMSKLIGSATGQFKSDVSEALGFDVGLLDSVIDVTTSTMEEVVDQASCYQAYANLSDNFVQTLTTLKETVEKNDSFDGKKPDDWKDFQKEFPKAIDELISSINASRSNNALYVMKMDSANLLMKNLSSKAFSIAATTLIGQIPFVRETKIVLGAVKYAADGFLNAADIKFSAEMIKRLDLIMYALDRVAYDQGGLLMNSQDQKSAFQYALRFDCAINMYQSALIQSCNHALKYYTGVMEAEFTKNQREHQWQTPTVAMYTQGRGPQGVQHHVYEINRQLHDAQNIFCHGDGPFYEEKPNSVNLFELKSGETLNMYLINCPVTVNVSDGDSNHFATLSDTKVDCPAGYEGYFAIIPESDGTYAKSIIVPSSYQLSFEGTGEGNVTAYVTEVDPETSEIERSYWFNEKPVDNGSEGEIEGTGSSSSPYEMIVDGVTYEADGGSDSAPDVYIDYGPEQTQPENPEPEPEPVPEPEQPTETDKPTTSVKSVKVYRLYHEDHKEHLYTTDANEVKVLTETAGWKNEGIGWNSPESGTGVYRLYSPVTRYHLYTTDENEVKVLSTERGWQVDYSGKPLFYSGGSVPVYRVYHEGQRVHHLTQDLNEYNTLGSWGWNTEGVKFYALSDSELSN